MRVLTGFEQSLNALKPLGTFVIVGIAPEGNPDIHNDLMADGKNMIDVIEADSILLLLIPQWIAYDKATQFPFDKPIKFYEPG